jgi:hypothetical protein
MRRELLLREMRDAAVSIRELVATAGSPTTIAWRHVP